MLLDVAAALDLSFATVAHPRTGVRLGWVGNPCEAATFAAPGSAIFHGNQLDARLVPFRTEDALIAALDSGTVDAASMNLPALLKALERGSNVRVVAGLHAGCLRLLARDTLVLNTFGDFRGKIIATDRLHGPSMSLLAAILRRQGVDPQRDVAWKVYSAPALESALDAKLVACVATSDPLGYVLLTDHKVEPYLDSAEGGFSCGADVAPGHHCFLVLHGGVVDTRHSIAASLTRAYLGATASIGRNVRPAALAEARGPFAADLSETLGMLSSYDWNASTDLVVEELEITARDFRRAGLLQRTTDPEELAERAFADVLHA